MGVKLMDSSLRDGGNVNEWDFGYRVIEGIIEDLKLSNIDIIELGYLKDVEFNQDKSLYNTIEEAKINISDGADTQEYSLMVQEDKWDWDKLTPCDGSIKHFRVSFHKYDILEGLELCKRVLKNGYVCHCNPINIMGYSDVELLELISKINDVKPDVFTIVDTFGSMDIDDIKRIDSLLQNNLNENILIAAHLHENLGLSYSLAQEFINYFENKREIIVDASILGIGRIPGNLRLELVMNYLNKVKHQNYCVDYIYDAIDDFIENIKEKYPWGYSVPYALSATYNLHRTYPEFLLNKGKLRTKDIRYLLESIDASERIIYNEKYIKRLYDQYIEVGVNDTEDIMRLTDKLRESKILLLAPGSTVAKYKDKIQAFKETDNYVVFSVNFVCDYINSDYIFFTNLKRYTYAKRYLGNEKVIVTSNLMHEEIDANYVINYVSSKQFGEYQIEDSVLCLLNILSRTSIKEVHLAGFDGFGEKNNFFDISYFNSYNSREHSDLVKRILQEKFSGLKLSFLTPSYYLENDND